MNAITDAARSRFKTFYESNGSNPYTTVFNSHLDVRMKTNVFGVVERVLDWTVRKSWGHHSNHAVKSPDGEPAGQADCAKELGVSKGAVSKAVRSLVEAGHMTVQGRLLFPVREPAGPKNGNVRTETRWQQFLQQRRECDPRVQQLEEAVSRAKRLRQELLVEFQNGLRARRKFPTRKLRQQTASIAHL